MSTTQTAAQLTEFTRRGAGTNSERLAALWLSAEAESRRRESTIETFWCRPNWALTHCWHLLLGISGSLAMVSNPTLGGALVLVGLICILADWLTGRSPGRRLTPERASQNVVSRAIPAAPPAGPDEPPRPCLIVTANYDAGRAGLAYRPWLRRATALPRRLAGNGRLTPGWLGWLVIAHVWLLAVAVVRHGEGSAPASSAVGVLQLIPTVVLVLSLALLIDCATADFGPSAADNAAGTAVALALTRALDAAPLRRLTVELVLQGAGDGQMIGLVRHLRLRKRELVRENTIVLGIGPCGTGRPHWWTSDGNLLPLRYHHRLRALAEDLADPQTGLDAHPHRGRGVAPALPARMRGIPAINLGCLDAGGRAAGSHTSRDTSDQLDPSALDELLQFALVLVDAIDADMAQRAPGGREATRPAAAIAQR